MRIPIEQVAEEAKAGDYAKELAKNPLFAGLLVSEKARLFSEFSRSKWFQYRLRHSIWAQLQAVNALDSKINGLLVKGEAAREEIKRRQKLDSMRKL